MPNAVLDTETANKTDKSCFRSVSRQDYMAKERWRDQKNVDDSELVKNAEKKNRMYNRNLSMQCIPSDEWRLEGNKEK